MTARFVVGSVHDSRPGDRVLALDLTQLRAAQRLGVANTPFHVALHAELESADEVTVEVPRWRGHDFLAVLEWLVCDKLAHPSSVVTWRAEKTGGATGLRRLLTERGWRFEERKSKAWRTFVGPPPAPGPFPQPPSFETHLGDRPLTFSCGWGAFSEGHVDAGTELLFEVAAAGAPVDHVLDVGTGYGPLAIGLVAAGRAKRATGTEVDSVALALAQVNADRAGILLDLELTDDPSTCAGADLVVCNPPTHAPAAETGTLVGALARHASGARVLVVVHRSLEQRFIELFAGAGADANVEARAQHTVLSLGGQAP